MVGPTVTEQEQLERLESQVENGGGGAWEYLCLVRKLRACRSDKVLKYGLSILNDPAARSKLGGDVGEMMKDCHYVKKDKIWAKGQILLLISEWTLYEHVAFAALDCQQHDVTKDCISVLLKQFPGSLRVKRLEALLLEAKGAWEEAERFYTMLLEDDPLDQLIRKRMVAMAKAQGNLSAAVDLLNRYLAIFMADHDAWRELAEIYISLQMYKQAAYCYEELILSQPTVHPYHLAYAEVLYTMGGLENLQTAKKYYASTITLAGGKSTRALYGVCLCTIAISQLTKGRNKEEKEGSDIHNLAVQALEKNYKLRAPGKLPLLTSMLKSTKLDNFKSN